MNIRYLLPLLFLAIGVTRTAFAVPDISECSKLPSHEQLRKALTEARKESNGGLNLDMWGSVVGRSGVVCAIAFTGERFDSQWPGSRVISAQKANTANAFSLKASALSTANLYAGTQPGGFLYGIQESNPVRTEIAYKGSASLYGSTKDPMVGERIGGINVFGGGLALYDKEGEILGGLGVSGDTSCADHNIAWRTRSALALDYVPLGVSSDKNDQITYDFSDSKSTSGFGHPTCVGTEDDVVSSLSSPRKIAIAK